MRVPVFEFDIEGPVQAEVSVLWLNGEQLELTGPCGAAPWYIEVGAGHELTGHWPAVLASYVPEPFQNLG